MEVDTILDSRKQNLYQDLVMVVKMKEINNEAFGVFYWHIHNIRSGVVF